MTRMKNTHESNNALKTSKRMSGLTCIKEKCIKINSSYSFIQPTIKNIIEAIKENYELPSRQCNDISLILSELLMNAVEHGNKNIYEKQITICYTIEPSCFHLSVEDEGKGFDLNHILHSTPSRGLSMIEILSNSLNINRRGNQISITYKLG